MVVLLQLGEQFLVAVHGLVVVFGPVAVDEMELELLHELVDVCRLGSICHVLLLLWNSLTIEQSP